MDPLTLALTVGGGLLSAGGSIADRLRARRESRRAIADLEPYTDPLQGFAQSRGILEAMNQMGTGNLAQLAARMGGSQGAAQAAGAEMGSQALSNAYLGALETGRERAFQAQAMQNQLRDTQSLLGGTMRDIGGVAMDVGIRRMMSGAQPTSPGAAQYTPTGDVIPAEDFTSTLANTPMLDVAQASVPLGGPANVSGVPAGFLEANVPTASQALPSVNMSPLAGGGVMTGGYDLARRPTLLQRVGSSVYGATEPFRLRSQMMRGQQFASQNPLQRPMIGFTSFNPMAGYNPNRMGSVTAGPMGVYGGPMDLATRRQASNPYSLDSLIQSGAYGNLFNSGVR